VGNLLPLALSHPRDSNHNLYDLCGLRPEEEVQFTTDIFFFFLFVPAMQGSNSSTLMMIGAEEELDCLAATAR
jgi:hypothetical protein